MIGYVTLGSNDVKKAADFYEVLLEKLNAKRIYDTDGFVAWSTGDDKPMLAVVKPYNGEPATFGNGTMIGLHAQRPELVDALHAKAIQLGGTNEGDPGPRMDGFYSGYFRDLDGNKLNFFCMK